jgi:hypothetical protein
MHLPTHFTKSLDSEIRTLSSIFENQLYVRIPVGHKHCEILRRYTSDPGQGVHLHVVQSGETEADLQTLSLGSHSTFINNVLNFGGSFR